MALASAPVLTLPTKEDYFTDASEFAIETELSQIQTGVERTIALPCYLNNDAIVPQKKELLAVVFFTRYFRYYLLGRCFTVRTDHSSLQWLSNFRYPEGQILRRIEELSQYNMTIQHRECKKHINSDALSRIKEDRCPFYKKDFKIEDLACGDTIIADVLIRNWENSLTLLMMLYP